MSAAVRITYYTDPLCSWSWAFEPEWRRLRYEFGDQLAWGYRMGGMIADWSSYSDPLNDIGGPAQMGPQWFQVGRLTGMPIDARIWQEDPPSSSYLACIAVKAAELQGCEHGERYLRRVREAVMCERRNVTRREVLLAIARELAVDPRSAHGFHVDEFMRALDVGGALEAFRDDLQDAAYRGIGRFPTLILQPADGQGVVITGYRPYPLLRAALAHVAPDLVPTRPAPAEWEYAAYWGRLSARELAEVCDPVVSGEAASCCAPPGHAM